MEAIPEILSLSFDLDNRLLDVFQSEENPEIEERIKSLNLGCEVKFQEQIADKSEMQDHTHQRKLLGWVLGINFAFFFNRNVYWLTI